MFGYVVVNKPEMKFKDFEQYHSYYCGLCQCLKKRYGAKGQISLSYDMTFLVILLSALYEPEEKSAYCRCVAHPFSKHAIITNQYTEYVADMNLLLTYYKSMDDWKDERKVTRFLYGKQIEHDNKKVLNLYKKKAATIQHHFHLIAEAEKENTENIDQIAGYFGTILGEIFAVKEDEWQPYLQKIGFSIGKFIYILDAYEDIEEDIKKGTYNVFVNCHQTQGFDDWIKQVLTLVITDGAREFEKLPIIEHLDILRNILYAGIWTRYELVRERRQNK